jgi:glycosyltransferase involved in cell wall biosynthesis
MHMTRALDLGCGTRPRNPFNADELFGVDIDDSLGAGVVKADLAAGPIPYGDNAFEFVTAFDLLQHIPGMAQVAQSRSPFIDLMNEVHRVLKPGGHFLAMTPAHRQAALPSDPAQGCVFTEETFPLAFDDVHRKASVDGFTGTFRIVLQEWRGEHIFAVMQKVSAPMPAVAKAEAASQHRISVVIPVYNGEKYIAMTLDSVLKQTCEDFEALCIDDCSTDASLDILESYAAKDSRVRVLRTPSNLGTAARALNHALGFMTGRYFVYSSQDDLFSGDWLQSMRERAIATGADAVIPDLVFHHSRDPARDRALIGLHGNRDAVLSNRDAFLHSLSWTIPGNALWNAGLVKRHGFDDFGLNADEFSVRRFFLACNKVVFSQGTFYYRQDNELAVTKRMSFKSFDYAYTQLRLYQLVRDSAFPIEVVHSEALKTVSMLNRLTQWLAQNRSTFSQNEAAQAEQRLERCMNGLRVDPMFAAVIPPPPHHAADQLAPHCPRTPAIGRSLATPH